MSEGDGCETVEAGGCFGVRGGGGGAHIDDILSTRSDQGSGIRGLRWLQGQGGVMRTVNDVATRVVG